MSALFLIEDDMLRWEHVTPAEHFIHLHQRLALYDIFSAHTFIDKISAFIEIIFFDQMLDKVNIPNRLKITVSPEIPAGTAHRQKIVNVIIVITEYLPGSDSTERKAAEGTVITGCHQPFRCGVFRIGVIFSFNSRHQVVFKIQMKSPQFTDRAAPAGIAAAVVKCRGNHDHGRNVTVFDQMVKHILCRGIVEIFTGMSSPAVHQIDDIVFRFRIVFVISVRKIDVSGFGDRCFVAGIIL